MMTNKRKHSYRELAAREWNKAILTALNSPAEVQESIIFWSRYIGGENGKHYQKLIDTLQSSLDHAAGLKDEFSRLGKKMHLGNYTPYTNEIKQALFSTLQTSLF